MKTFLKILGCCCATILMLLTFSSCKKQHYDLLTTSDVNIVDYMRKYPDRFSEYLKVLDRVNISPFLNAYGTYTCFAPTNDAFKQYLKDVGKTSTDEIDTATLKDICRMQIINDTIRTNSFTDGKIATPTMYGQFLTTGVSVEGNTIVNRVATIMQSNVLTGNGLIHVIDHVLTPSKKTISQVVEANPKYSIFTQALKATGWYDTLNTVNLLDSNRRWQTFLAESDSVLKLKGINTYTDLKNKYNNTGNPKNPKDSLNLYMAYHILPGIKYLADIISAQSHPTYAPQQVVTVTIDGQTILLNEAVFNNVKEAGVQMDRGNSDNSCSNGVVHALLGDVLLKVRNPYAIYWDVCDQPELRKMSSTFRKAGKSVTLTLGQLADVTWGPNPAATIAYSVEAATTTNYYYYDDHFDVTLRLRADNSLNSYIEFKTPLIVAGKYKVWICYRRNGGQYEQILFDGEPLSRICDFTQYIPSTTATPEVLESQGYKRYASTPASNSTQVAQLGGVINVTSTDRHTLRIQCIKDQNGLTQLDMIHFIPIDMTQTRPLFARDGTIVP